MQPVRLHSPPTDLNSTVVSSPWEIFFVARRSTTFSFGVPGSRKTKDCQSTETFCGFMPSITATLVGAKGANPPAAMAPAAAPGDGVGPADGGIARDGPLGGP